MKQLKNWTAKRSGASMTVKATDVETGEEVTLSRIMKLRGAVELGSASVLATSVEGATYELVPGGAHVE